MDAGKNPDRKGEATGDARLSQSPKSRRKPDTDLPSVESPSLAPSGSVSLAAGQDAPDSRQVESRTTPESSQSPIAPALSQIVDGSGHPQRAIGEGGASAPSPARSFIPKKLPPIAATFALAICIGAAAGSLATIGFELALSPQGEENLSSSRALRASIAQLNTDLAKLKAGVEASGANVGGELGWIAARLDRAENAQAEPAAKIAKLNEAIERLERRGQLASTTPAPVPPAMVPTVGAKTSDVTGAIAQPQSEPPAASKDTSRLPVVRGWVLRNVYDGAALIQGPRGLVEVEIGDPLPGGGRIEAIRRQSGRWVVVTSRGLIVAR